MPESGSLRDALSWLHERGVEVEVVEGSDFTRPQFGTHDVERLVINGYDNVFVAALESQPTESDLIDAFDLHADYTPQNVPTIILAGSNVFLVRGLQQDVIDEIVIAVWDLFPAVTVVPLGAGLRDGFEAGTSLALAETWLSRKSDGKLRSVSSPVLVRLDKVYSLFDVTPVVSNLPHPHSYAWVNVFENAAGHFHLLASEVATGIVVAELESQQVPDTTQLEHAELPGISSVLAVDGDEGSHDELHAVVMWEVARPVEHVGDLMVEQVDSYVIERRGQPGSDWRPIAWIRSDARDMTRTPPAAFVPPAGRATLEPARRGSEATISYWDYDVEAGVTYTYRVYGCTSLGRRTDYSPVTSAIAGDPDSSTPDIAAHRPSELSAVSCLLRRD